MYFYACIRNTFKQTFTYLLTLLLLFFLRGFMEIGRGAILLSDFDKIITRKSFVE